MGSVGELLQRRAAERPADRAFVFVDDGDLAVGYAELDAAARRVAAAVSARGGAGAPVLLLYPPGRGYVEGFFGCLYAGAIAVPAYPPDPARLARTLPRLRSLVAGCGARLALGTSELIEALPAIGSRAPELGALDWIATDRLRDDPAWTPPRVAAGAPALLQYTSGSTGAPRGVLLEHANLMHNAELVRAGFGATPLDVGVSWLPPYHDMGLVGGIVQPVYTGLPTVLMSPLTFLARPLTWLEAMSRFGATISGGPNFAFELCVRRTTPQQRAGLDLSRWAVAFCGAEPVRAATIERFCAAFRPAGFRPEAFYPCYGLAEATLIVTGGRRGAPPRLVRNGGAVRVGCGSVLGDQRVAVVDPETHEPCPPGREGEIWVAGPSVARGYWNRPAESERTFRARCPGSGAPHLRTGDLGVLEPDGELVITGRIKDLIVVRGRNLHPQDLEHAVERGVAGVRPGCSAAFAVAAGGEERVAFACEVAAGVVDAAEPGGSDGALAATVAAVRQELAEAAEVSPAAVVLLRPRTIPKTSSGKIQRHACREALARGGWRPGGPDVVALWTETGDDVAEDGWGGGGSVAAIVADALGLGRREPAADAPLTGLGLDSLRAVELRHALHERAGLDVPLSDLLSGVTVAELTRRAEQVAGRATSSAEPVAGRAATRAERAPSRIAASRTAGRPGPDAAAEEPADPADYPLNDGQHALWLLQRSAPGSTAYQITRAARIRSELDAGALERAFGALVRRHPALRLRLPSERGRPVPRLCDPAGPVLERHDVAGLDGEALRRLVQRDGRRGFDLERGPLFRVALYTLGPRDHVLLLSVHHVISDFWSLSVLVDDLLRRYRSELAGTPEPPRQGRGQRHHPPATDPDIGGRLDYWRATLAGAPAALELPTSFRRPRLQSFRGATRALRIEPAVLAALDAVARRAATTRFVTLLAAFAALLARYTGEDVVIAAPTTGREDPRTAGTFGYLVQPVPLRLLVAPGTPFLALVARAREVVLGALSNVVAFPRLVEAVRPARDPSRSPVAQVMLVLQQAPPGRPDLAAFAVGDETAEAELGGLRVRPYPLADTGAAADLSLTLAEVAGGLTGSLEYCVDLFDEPAAERFARQFTTLLRRATATPDAPVGTLDLMDEAERAMVLGFAGTSRRGAAPATLHTLFAGQAARRPDAVAVVNGRRTLSYAELDRRSGELAAVLRGRFGVRRGDPVGVCLPRHEDGVIALWAVLKAGGAYLPLEPELPPRRLGWMIADARPVALLTHRRTDGRLPPGGPPRLRLDEPLPDETAYSAPETEITPDDLAYIIYTSGSTGRPKGVLVPHRGSWPVSSAEASALELGERDRLLLYASCAYDVSLDDVLIAHLHGAAVVITPPEATVPGPELVRLLAEQRVTTLTVSPSALAALPSSELPDLARILLGGEPCSAELVARWAPGRRFVNGYGPTETTVCATLEVCRAGDGHPGTARPPIGRPIPGVHVYVLDGRMAPVPIGVPGELFIGGIGVAWGYLGRPGLTAERFLPDPFGPVPGARLYRTGDRVRWLAGGALDFLGRLDHQVKIRGARIEPGEIEARLQELFDFRQIAVVPRPTPVGGSELVAYLVADGPLLPVAELRARLRAELPGPWIPAAFVYLDALPLNTSHKLDREALPDPSPADRGVTARVAPRTELERAVAGVWASILGVPEVGARDHFFDELGGSSMLVGRLASELGERLGVDVPVTHLFEHPTVEALAGRIAQDTGLTEGRLPGAGTGPQPEDHAGARRRALAARRRSAGGGR